MEFKGTKGKWELSDDKRNICVLVKPQTYKTICSNFYNTKWQYDAKIIASAPEMFELLKIIMLTPAYEKAKDLYGNSNDHWTNRVKELLTKITE
jgi:hypothetical protein